ncbi:hypothetical protein [Ralstonia sp.]|uniref:hypothetical protein n=1 Tax=Ralstonia sp. TaxID=54061 RepID=UPI0031D9BF05
MLTEKIIGTAIIVIVWGLCSYGFVKFWRYWDTDKVLGRMTAGMESAWADHLRWCRYDFMESLRMREEAYLELDGSKLDLADEFLRDELHTLGGLAGAW